jgi:hypothetical protein
MIFVNLQVSKVQIDVCPYCGQKCTTNRFRNSGLYMLKMSTLRETVLLPLRNNTVHLIV